MKNSVKLFLMLFLVPGLYAMEKSEIQWKHWVAEHNQPKNMEKREEREKTRQESIECIAESFTDKQRARTAAASLPADLHGHIWNFGDEVMRKKRFIAHHTEQLLPALLPYGDKDFPSKKNIIFSTIQKLKQEHVIYRAESMQAGTLPDQEQDPRLYFHGHVRVVPEHNRFGSRLILGINRCLPTLASERETLDIKPGEFHALYYTNGLTLFKVHDATNHQLEQLSEQQLTFLANLYTARQQALTQRAKDTLTLSHHEQKLFFSLPKDIQKTVKANYSITNIHTTWDTIEATTFYMVLMPVAAITIKYISTCVLNSKM